MSGLLVLGKVFFCSFCWFQKRPQIWQDCDMEKAPEELSDVGIICKTSGEENEVSHFATGTPDDWLVCPPSCQCSFPRVCYYLWKDKNIHYPKKIKKRAMVRTRAPDPWAVGLSACPSLAKKMSSLWNPPESLETWSEHSLQSNSCLGVCRKPDKQLWCREWLHSPAGCLLSSHLPCVAVAPQEWGLLAAVPFTLPQFPSAGIVTFGVQGGDVMLFGASIRLNPGCYLLLHENNITFCY